MIEFRAGIIFLLHWGKNVDIEKETLGDGHNNGSGTWLFAMVPASLGLKQLFSEKSTFTTILWRCMASLSGNAKGMADGADGEMWRGSAILRDVG